MVIALARSNPPEGFQKWTFKLLAQHAEQVLGKKISDVTIWSLLKKEAFKL
jgi:hypothetical protein